MRQHIEPKDLEQLTAKGKEKLREWWKTRAKRGDLCYHSYGGMCVVTNNYNYELVVGYEPRAGVMVDVLVMKIPTVQFLPLLYLGQMIEFLEENSTDVHFIGQRWHRYVIKEVQDNGDILIPYSATELCDALWSACVEILNKE